LSQWRPIEAPGNERKLLVHADNAWPHPAKLSTQYFNENRMKSAPHPPYSILLWSRAVGLLSLRGCQEMFRRPLIRGCRSASCSSRRCSRGYWKSDLASGLSRVDGPIKEMYCCQWGVYWVSSNECHWGMEFYSADIEMRMFGWNTLHQSPFLVMFKSFGNDAFHLTIHIYFAIHFHRFHLNQIPNWHASNQRHSTVLLLY
jgi:hypothetical protein